MRQLPTRPALRARPRVGRRPAGARRTEHVTSVQTVVPSARRLMSSLRDIGYDLPAAVADLVDNSIDADARNINIDIQPEGAHSWIRVADDGIGMSRGRLEEAMRYGSARSYGDADLGAFGLGLKTASL